MSEWVSECGYAAAKPILLAHHGRMLCLSAMNSTAGEITDVIFFLAVSSRHISASAWLST